MNVKSYQLRDIATLGPEGTDSEDAARQVMKSRGIGGRVSPCNSFYDAVEHAIANHSYCLIPAAFKRSDEEGKVVDTWGDLNFREQRLELIDALVLPLKEMCFARNNSCENPESIALHPATTVFADKFAPELERKAIDSKPLAVKACSDGIVDMCIGSSDVVESFPNLTIERRFTPNMIWALYRPRSYS